jgi:hypothetical protein
MKPRLAISFSGGRTSAVMTKRLLEKCKDTHEISVTFANTGCEHPLTLDFIRDCDKHFGFGTVWLEAEVSPEEGVGIRADEADRMSVTMREKRLIYPLVKDFIRKEDVLAECAKWPFDLRLHGEHYGNCTWCWKKSLRKLLTVAKHNPELFDFPAEMDAKFAHHRKSKATTSPQGDRRFFRKHLNTADILALSKGEFEEFVDISKRVYDDPLLDTGSSCGESCEIGADN